MSDILIYTLGIADKNSLLAAYMPYVKNGGVFIKAAQHPVGSVVGVLLNIPGDPDVHAISGKVVWLAQKTQVHEGGIGIQFPDTPECSHVKNKIETLLGGMDRTKVPTMTA